MKTATQGPKTANAVDTIKTIIIISSTIVISLLLIAFYYLCWQVLSTKSHNFAIAWSLVSTTFIIVGTLTGLGIGAWFGIKQTDLVMNGIKMAIGQVIHAAEQVSEVRVTTMGRYGRLQERKGTQEWLIDGDLFGVQPRPISPPIEMPADQTGRKGE